MFKELDGGLQILKALKITWASFYNLCYVIEVVLGLGTWNQGYNNVLMSKWSYAR